MSRPEVRRTSGAQRSHVTSQQHQQQQQQQRFILLSAENQRCCPPSNMAFSLSLINGRSKGLTDQYDPTAKQVEVLEKKYGGTWRSRHAATVIQRAYRQFCLARNFAKLRWEADGNRLSRRFGTHSQTVWSDLARIQEPEPGAGGIMACSDYDNMMTRSHSSDNMMQNFIAQKQQTPSAFGSSEVKNRRNPGRAGEIAAGEITVRSSLTTTTTAADGDDTYVGSRGVVSSSELESTVDRPSECFENVLEEVDVLDDSFTSVSDDDDDDDDDDDATTIGESSKDDGTLRKTEDGGDKRPEASPGKSSPSNSPRTVLPPDDPEQSPDGSPVWKRKSRILDGLLSFSSSLVTASLSPSSSSSVESRSAVGREEASSSNGVAADAPSRGCSPSGDRTTTTSRTRDPEATAASTATPAELREITKNSDRSRKRAYRIGLNLFNKKPENGIRYLITKRFLDHRPIAVAKFLISRKGLSKQLIGEYLGNLQDPFNMDVLSCFAEQIELNGLPVDVALRKFQSYFRMPGEAQKIERLMEAFATRYCLCNPDHKDAFRSSETVFLLAFAIIMLNTDLHNSNIKPDKKMKASDFLRNLRGIDGGQDINASLLSGIYERIRGCELKPGADHVSHVFLLEQMIFGHKPRLALSHRRLVCYCRMYEVIDPAKRDRAGQHQRELFLFNDVLMITKLFNKKKKTTPMYSFRQLFSLFGMVVHVFESPFYKHGLRLSSSLSGSILIMLNARSEHDRTKFVDDVKESILEITEMEGMRVEGESQKMMKKKESTQQQRLSPGVTNSDRLSKDSGVVDVEALKLTAATAAADESSSADRLSAPECDRLRRRRSPLSNSLNDVTDHNRRSSGISLDSGVVSTEPENAESTCPESRRLSQTLRLSLAPGSSSSTGHVP